MKTPIFNAEMFLLLIIASFCISSCSDVPCVFTVSDVTCEGAVGKFLNDAGPRDLNAIYIITSDISELRSKDFLAFPLLTIVSIFESYITFPTHEYISFEGLRYLNDLRIEYCNATESVKLLFAKNNNITSLSLPGNKISIVTNDFFGHLHQINNINLSGNEIEYIEIGVFERLNSLRTLNLTNNRLGTSFDPLFLTVTSLTCVVCRANNIKKCTEDEVTRCKVNIQIDQLWWKTHSVDIYLTNNPVCAAIVSGYPKPNLKTNVNAKINNITLNNCKTGSCFKHDSRKMFLLEACYETNSEIQIDGRDIGTSSILDTPNIIVEAQEEEIKDEQQIKLTIASITSLLGAVALLGILFGFLGSLFYKNNEISLAKICNSQYTSVPVHISPLHDAAHRGILDEVHRLIKEGNNPTESDENGDTPLHLAAQGNHTDVVKYLLVCNVDVNDRNKSEATPLINAAKKQNWKTVQLLLENGADKDASDSSGNTALHYAAYNGNRETMKILLEKGANEENKDNEGKTPLFQASVVGHHDIVKLLLDKQANVNTTAHDGKTPLHIASWNGHHKIVDLLLQFDAEVNKKDNKGYTPLHNCSRKGHIKVLKHLLENNKLDINVTDGENNTALHHAASGGSIEVFNILLGRGADAMKQNKDNQTPLMVADVAGNKELADTLKEKFKTNPAPVHYN